MRKTKGYDSYLDQIVEPNSSLTDYFYQDSYISKNSNRHGCLHGILNAPRKIRNQAISIEKEN